ncbi:MAG: tetratricopeptide repeat protein [Anaerolineae bacterium]|nr:tetratricopeptide repeat protein [Anaerolineae bacterium]
MPTHRSVVILLALILMVAFAPQPVAAQSSNGAAPLILVAVPGKDGEQLAGRLGAAFRLLGTAGSARHYSGPVTSIDAALRAGRYFDATVIVWVAPDAPTDLRTTVRGWAFIPAPSITGRLPLAGPDARPLVAAIHTIVGQALAVRGRCLPALSSLHRAIDLAPRRWPGLVEARYYRGMCYAQAGDLPHALEDLDTARSSAAAPWYVHHAAAWVNADLGQYAAALAAADEAIASLPDNPDLLADRAYFHRQMGNNTAALADLDRAVARQPESIPFRLSRAEVLTTLGRYRAALADVEAGLALNPPDRAPLLFQRGLLHLYLNRPAAAVDDLRAYTTLRPEDPSGWVNLGQAHERSGETFSAIQAYETALSVAPEATYLYSTLARLYYEAAGALPAGSLEAERYLELAELAATAALNAYSQDAAALLYRALARLARGENTLALEDLSAGIDIAPDLDGLRFNRAVLYARLGEAALDRAERERLLRAALEDYAVLLRLDFPAYSYLLPTIGALYVDLGAYEEAIEHFAAYDELYPAARPDQPEALARARAYDGVGRYTDAAAAYTRALEGDSPALVCQARLALGILTGRRLGRPADAAELLRRYLADGCTRNPVTRAALEALLNSWQGAESD